MTLVLFLSSQFDFISGVPQHWCTCQDSKPIDKNLTVVQKVTNFVVTEINNILAKHSYCAPVILDGIIDASLSQSEIDEKDVIKVYYYTVIFRSLFVGAIFEATVKCIKCNGEDFSMAGDISRNNLYGHQGDCVKDAKLRLYCYCKT